MEIIRVLVQNPWIFLIFLAIVVILWIDHWLKERTRYRIGDALSQYEKAEHESARIVEYPKNLKGRRGEVRAAGEDYTGSIESYFKHKTWPLWLTILLLALIGGAVWLLLKGIGVL